MKKKEVRQYTIRDVPIELDRLLRKRAREEQISLNRAALRIIEKELTDTDVVEFDDLDFCIGSWHSASKVEEELKEQRKIDKKLWL